MKVKEKVKQNIQELNEIADSLDEQQLEKAAEVCVGATRIFFSGMGRSGNMVKALAIRFMHLGFEAYVAGDASTPSIRKGDLLVAVTASAKTKVTLNHMEIARREGAEVILITAQTEYLGMSDYVITIPARTKVATQQHAGSLFEQSVLVVGDALAAAIQEKKGIAAEDMNYRHANLQ